MDITLQKKLTTPSMLDVHPNQAHEWIRHVKTNKVVKADFLNFFSSLKSKIIKKNVFFFNTSPSILVLRRTEAHQWIRPI